MNDSKVYADLVKANGEVNFSDSEYALIGPAQRTNSMFPGWFGDASEGETYVDQWSAPAMGRDGEEYVIRWEFDVTKGAEPEDDSHDWDDVSEVIPA